MTAWPVLAHIGLPGAGWRFWVVPVLAGLTPAALYVMGVRRIRQRYGRRWFGWRTASFLSGCALVAVALTPAAAKAPLADTSAHMVQHLLLGMYAPLGLVLGAPITLALGASPPTARRTMREVLGSRWFRAPTNLTVVTAVSAGGLWLLYLTPLYALSTRSDLVHHLIHLHFLVAGFLFTWVVAGPDPLPRRPRMPWRIGALIVASGSHGVLAKLLYARAADLPPDAGVAPADVEDAAQWMYYGGHLAEALILVALFAGWYRKAPRLRRVPAAHAPVAI